MTIDVVYDKLGRCMTIWDLLEYHISLSPQPLPLFLSLSLSLSLSLVATIFFMIISSFLIFSGKQLMNDGDSISLPYHEVTVHNHCMPRLHIFLT